ncbi:hypothetical protein [Uliginosibacterium flavum]|uniref:hypothetical protein n=1 Tax=Uliginosibacterium flavum TaxID=1396831 RepID=UPI00339BD75A
MLEAADGATVILSAGKATKPTPLVNDMATPTMRSPERTAQADMSLRMPPVSMALERERQHGDEEAEKKGKTVLVAVFSAIALLVLIALGMGWYLTRESAPPKPVAEPAEASAPLAEPQVAPPVMVEQSVPVPASAPVLELAPALVPESASAPEPVAVPDKPVSKPKAARKLSEEEEYLRQIRRQLGQ